MPDAPKSGVKWLSDVEDHDYPAAESYLGLLHGAARVAEIMKGLKGTPVVQFKAKDIFRASRLSLLGVAIPTLRRTGRGSGTAWAWPRSCW